jgi:DNA-directed RNA polymerase III subunit RPC4
MPPKRDPDSPMQPASGRLQSISQRTAGRGRGSTTGRFTPKVVARRTKEERDSTAPADKPEVKPPVKPEASLPSRGGARGGRGLGRGRGRGRFEPVVHAAIGPLAGPSGADPRQGGSRFHSLTATPSLSPSPGLDLLGVMSTRTKSETPFEIEDPNRIDMSENTPLHDEMAAYFPVRLDRRDDEDDEEQISDEVNNLTIGDDFKIKEEPTDDVPIKKEESLKKRHGPLTAKKVEYAGLEEEKIRELRRIAQDHKIIAKEFNMKSTAEGETVPNIENRLYFFQFPMLMPELVAVSADDDDEVMVIDEPVKAKGPSYELPEGLIGKLRLHKSGKLTMVVGNVVMEVSQGTECNFLQDVVIMDEQEKKAYLVGQISKKMVLSPELTR